MKTLHNQRAVMIQHHCVSRRRTLNMWYFISETTKPSANLIPSRFHAVPETIYNVFAYVLQDLQRILDLIHNPSAKISNPSSKIAPNEGHSVPETIDNA